MTAFWYCCYYLEHEIGHLTTVDIVELVCHRVYERVPRLEDAEETIKFSDGVELAHPINK